MNFSSDSLKHESKTQNEDFSFDLETPRGHFFAVIDFDSHDFANLNATLKGKLETIVNSFVSLSRFSADLFLGFLAKEINNFLYNLREQAGGPQLVGSAVFCLVSGNRLNYLLCGNIAIRTWNSGKVTTLGPPPENSLQKLGRTSLESPLTESVQSFTLDDEDVALVMTAGVTSSLDAQILSSRLEGLADAKAIRDALMKASVTSKDDRTVLVITGPYERYVDPMVFDLTRAVAALEARVDALTQAQRQTVDSPVATFDEPLRRVEDRLAAQIASVREEVRGKAGSIDFLELDEKMSAFAALVEGKADKADVLGLQSELLKMSVATGVPPAKEDDDDEVKSAAATDPDAHRSLLMKVAGIVLVVGLGGGFLGAWLQSRLMRRLVAGPAQLAAQAPVPTPQPTASPVATATPGVTDHVVQAGDSLRKLAQQYNVPEQAIRDSNPTVARWETIQPGQKIVVPATPVATASPATATSPVPGTVEVIVGPGDSINRFAQRYGTTPARIRELNPHITNWASIKTGQKVLLPTPPSG
ncbi:MAG TPA: LysM peptidoglycan-binding domain-containing protein [Pyrinomonadaceae bacterium]|nr:LysM peptidoglycan-binding domain-containing protein [Pyrinomonadaceae bacterium]